MIQQLFSPTTEVSVGKRKGLKIFESLSNVCLQDSEEFLTALASY